MRRSPVGCAGLAALHNLLAFVPLIVFACAARPSQAPITLRDRCDTETACVPMTLDVSSSDPLRVVQVQDSVGFTTFELRLHGRLAGRAEADHLVRVRGYTDGIECSAFGQAKAAVIGHSIAGHPILLTDQGVLELADTVLLVGCLECAKIRNRSNGQLVATRRTPGWDPALAGSRADSLLVGPEGELFLRTGSAFIELNAAGPFRRMTSAPRSGPYRLELKQGACT